MSRRVIITCAGKAGAAIAHIHVRHPETGKPSMATEHYREVVERIRDSGSPVIVNLTTGPGARLVPSDTVANTAAPGSGTHPGDHQTYGHSLIVDPLGRLVAEAGEAPEAIIADIDLAESSRVRSTMPALDQERAFSVVTAGQRAVEERLA